MTSNTWLDLMTDAKSSGGFAPLPDGDYDLKVLEATASTTSNGKPMYTIKAEVQTGPHAKRLVWDRLIVSKDSPGALRFFFRKMSILGLDEGFFASGPSDAAITQGLTGRSFRGKLATREYQGKQSNEIKEYYPAQAGGAGFPAPAVPAPAAAPAPAPAVAPPPAAAPAAPAPAPAAPAPQAQSPWETTAPAPAPAPPAPGGFVAPPQPPF